MLGITWVLVGRGPLHRTSQVNQNLVLIHGFDNDPNGLRSMKNELEQKGYYVYQLQYNPYSNNWESIIDSLNAQLERRIDTALVTHFVTHSVGSVCLRKFMEQRKIPNMGKTVFISPINEYSPVLDFVFSSEKFVEGKQSAVYTIIETDGALSVLPLPEVFGVIAANKPAYNLSEYIAGQHDGVVSVNSTQMQGMSDYVLIADDHNFIRYNLNVADEIAHFLKKGVFIHPNEKKGNLFALE